MVESLGSDLENLASEAVKELVLCAPFAKSAVVKRLLSRISSDVQLTIFTRWRPEEVAAGVSDTSVLHVASAVGGEVLLCDRLHAKFYRSENQVYVGSANLTGKALGWAPAPNLELLTLTRYEEVCDLEADLRRVSIRATQELAEQVDALARQLSVKREAGLDAELEPAGQSDHWRPTLRDPKDLYRAYSKGCSVLSTASSQAAGMDLIFLDIPVGYDESTFHRLVALRLLRERFVTELDEYLAEPRRFGEVVGHLRSTLKLDRDEAVVVWQTTMRWLLEFLSDRYERKVQRHTEVIARRGDGR